MQDNIPYGKLKATILSHNLTNIPVLICINDAGKEMKPLLQGLSNIPPSPISSDKLYCGAVGANPVSKEWTASNYHI